MEPKNVAEQIPIGLNLSTEVLPDGSKVLGTPVSESRNKSAVLSFPKDSIYCDSSDGSSSNGSDSSDSSSGSTASKKDLDYTESVGSCSVGLFGSCSVESVGSCSVDSESSDATSAVTKVLK